LGFRFQVLVSEFQAITKLPFLESVQALLLSVQDSRLSKFLAISLQQLFMLLDVLVSLTQSQTSLMVVQPDEALS
jgi:hypothetical protein